MDATSAINAVAAVASALGGAAAAVAAFRSAGSARIALNSASEAEHRANLREIGTTAATLAVEVERVRACERDLLIEYRDAEVFSGSHGHSGFKELRERVTEKALGAIDAGRNAALFVDGAKSLKGAPADETDRVLLELVQALVKVRAIREDLWVEQVRVEEQNAAQRERVLRVPSR